MINSADWLRGGGEFAIGGLAVLLGRPTWYKKTGELNLPLRQSLRSQAGGSLIEVLVALGIVTAAIIPMLDLTVLTSGLTPFQRQIALTLAVEKTEDLGNQTYRTGMGTKPDDGYDDPPVSVGRYQFNRSWEVSQYEPVGLDDYSPEKNRLWTTVVTVTCINCGRINPTVRLVTTIDKN